MALPSLDRRNFLKQMAYAYAVALVTALKSDAVFSKDIKDISFKDISWKKSPCRFCGVGCGLLIGIYKGKAIAVKGDPKSPVNKGLLCAKGYHSVQMLYGEDRIKHAFVRKDGVLKKVPISDALDIVANKIKETIAKSGKDSVSIYGSGQWTIPDGYVASKLMKGCIGSNNLEANARLCMASAVTGFITSFGMDEPMGCYEDIDYADTFVLWGNNMAEMHPVLFSRILERKRSGKKVKIIDLATRKTRTSHAASHSYIFYPNTDLALANGICHHIIYSNKHNKKFIEEFCSIKSGKTDIGYGLSDKFKFKDKAIDQTFSDYKEFLKDYSPKQVEKITGIAAEDIEFLADLYADPNRKAMSLWCMGMNQHTRGTWINNLVYNIHLILGKISTPGNSPFSLTGQPSACGTVREVGTLTHKLPKGVVTNPKSRAFAAKVWQVPESKIPAKPTYNTVEMFRALDRGDIKFMWIQVTNPMVTMPSLKRYRDGSLKKDRFIVVSDVYPTPTTEIADVILPSSLWIEREGMFGNSERRTQHFEKMVNPPGEAKSDAWQMIEVAKKLGFEKQFPWNEENHIEEIWKEYRKFHENPKHNMATYKELKANPGVQWPVWKGMETKWRFNSEYDPAAKNGKKFDFYGKPDHRAVIWIRPFENPPEMPDKDYPFILCTGRVLEHWHTGSMTRRIEVLHQAVPSAYVEINSEDAKEKNIKNGDWVEITSRRGKIKLKAVIDGRGSPVPKQIFVPFFDEAFLINEVTLDAYDPISKQPDYKKCAVKIEKVS